MPNFDKIVGGIGILIFVYLLFNARNVSQVAGSLGGQATNLIKALQGR